LFSGLESGQAGVKLKFRADGQDGDDRQLKRAGPKSIAVGPESQRPAIGRVLEPTACVNHNPKNIISFQVLIQV